MAAHRQARVTIVIPTYRRVGMLRSALQSVLAQSFPDFLALICDNDNSDEVAALVESFDDPRLVHLRRPQNIGMVANALTGLQTGESEYVIELDDDDLLHPHCLARLVPPLEENPDLALSFGAMRLIDHHSLPIPHGDRRETVPQLPGLRPGVHRPFTELAVRGMVYMPATLWRRSAIDWAALPADLGTAYDRFLAIAAAHDGAAAFYVNQPVMDYRLHPEADGVVQYVRQLGSVIDLLEAELPGTRGRDRQIVREEIVRSRLRQIRALTRQRQWSAALRSARPLAKLPFWAALARIGAGLTGRRLTRSAITAAPGTGPSLPSEPVPSETTTEASGGRR